MLYCLLTSPLMADRVPNVDSNKTAGFAHAEPFEAQEMANRYAAELGVQTVSSPNIVHTQEGGYMTADAAAAAGYKVRPARLMLCDWLHVVRLTMFHQCAIRETATAQHEDCIQTGRSAACRCRSSAAPGSGRCCALGRTSPNGA